MSVPNWLGLLKWSLNQGDGTVPSPSQAMSAEDKAFLEKVMKECVQDEPARMQEIMTKLVNSLEAGNCSEESDEIESNLEELKYIVDQIDMAEVFAKFGGIECLLRLIELDSLETGARSQAASVLGTICQNNIKVQAEVFNKGTLNRLTALFNRIDLHKLRTKILFSISCLIRNLSIGEDAFVHTFARDLFHSALQCDVSEQSALWSRALYLGAALLNPDVPHGDRVDILAECFIPHSFAALSSPSVDTREGFLALLEAFINYPVSTGKRAVIAHQTALETLLGELNVRIQGCHSSAVVGSETEEDRRFQLEQHTHEREILEGIIASLAVENPLPSIIHPSMQNNSSEMMLLLDSPQRSAAPNT